MRLFALILIYLTVALYSNVQFGNDTCYKNSSDNFKELISLIKSSGFEYRIYSPYILEIKSTSNEITLLQRYDKHGRLIFERFPNDKTIEISYEEDRIKSIFIDGNVLINYEYDNGKLIYVHRSSSLDDISYSYEYLRDENEIIKASNVYCNNKINHVPLFGEAFLENDLQIARDISPPQVVFDERGNIVQKISENLEQSYVYDAFDRLIESRKNGLRAAFSYDPFGRRLSKKVVSEDHIQSEFYLYCGNHEIAAFDDQGELLALRIPGITFHKDIVRGIIYESKNNIFATVFDERINLNKLINLHDQTEIEFSISSFGNNLSEQFNCFPWLYAAKHYDKELNLVYYGSRYYDPALRQWLSPDPLGQIQSDDLYEFCFNDPSKYIDPDGRFVIAIPLLWTAGVTLTEVLIDAAIISGISWLGYKGIEKINELDKELIKDKRDKELPFDGKELGDDPTKCPGEGYNWKGKGPPGSGQGSWVKGNGPGKEILYPDLSHPLPIGPHWDYHGPDFPNGIRIKPDGTWEPK